MGPLPTSSGEVGTFLLIFGLLEGDLRPGLFPTFLVLAASSKSNSSLMGHSS